jgi:hypothetical protein
VKAERDNNRISRRNCGRHWPLGGPKEAHISAATAAREISRGDGSALADGRAIAQHAPLVRDQWPARQRHHA